MLSPKSPEICLVTEHRKGHGLMAIRLERGDRVQDALRGADLDGARAIHSVEQVEHAPANRRGNWVQ